MEEMIKYTKKQMELLNLMLAMQRRLKKNTQSKNKQLLKKVLDLIAT